MIQKELICIVCPIGCLITAEIDEDGTIGKVSGNSCPRGKEYAINELKHPVRTLTSTMIVANRDNAVIPVKTDRAIPKEKLFEIMDIINRSSAAAPIKIGDILIKDVFEGSNVVATGSME